MTKTEKGNQIKSKSGYTGRWVARIKGKIIAQGYTPNQARRAAQNFRHKESPEIIFMSPYQTFSPILASVYKDLPPDQEIFLVGGAVRDAILGRTSHDLDFAVPTNGIKLARKIADKLKGAFYVLDDQRDTGRVVLVDKGNQRTILDFSIYRGKDIQSDLRERDFSINGIAYDLRADTFIDPLNGIKDIHGKLLRACSSKSFEIDPIRILRAVRFAAGLDFQIDEKTRLEMQQAGVGLRSVSPERVRDELFRIFEGPQPESAIRALEILGVLPHILPELSLLKNVEQPTPHVYDVWMHTLSIIKYLEEILNTLVGAEKPISKPDTYIELLDSRLGPYRSQFTAHFATFLNADRSLRALLIFAALYHDVAKPICKTTDENARVHFRGHDKQGAEIAAERANALHLSNDEIKRLQLIINHHMHVKFHSIRLEKEGKPLSRKAIYRFFRDTGVAGVDLMLLGLADTRATYGNKLYEDIWSATLDTCKTFLENYWDKPNETVSPPRLVDGNEVIIEYDLKPGPRVGELLEAIREAQAIGEIKTRAEAIAFGHKWLEEHSDQDSAIK